MYSGEQKKENLVQLALEASQVHSICHDHTLQDPEKNQACTEESSHCGGHREGKARKWEKKTHLALR